MKRRMLALLLAVLMLAMLTAAAFAADEVQLGAYNLTGGLTVVGVSSDGGFYKGADTFELNCSGLTGEYSLVLLLEGDSPVPTDGNIQYIDQMSIANGAVKFTLKPKALKVGTYNIYISTTDEALKKVASFKYGEKPDVVLGDVDGDGKIKTTDALLVLQHVSETITLEGNEFVAADVDKDGVIKTTDALLILQYVAENIGSFD